MGVTRGFTLVAGGVTVNLRDPDSLSTAGLAGIGLPDVEPQWLTGAGDGSVYRGARVMPRALTMPVLLAGDTAADLLGQLDDLSTVLSPENAPARLTMTLDPGGAGEESWWLDVIRAGGGDFAMGETTDGETYAFTTVDLVAGDPYWTATTATTVDPVTLGTSAISNTGTAPAWPVFTIDGPATGFTLAQGGRSLTWAGTLGTGETITVDAEDGTVSDGTGANRFGGLSAAPKFWTVPPGSNSAVITMTGTGAGSQVAVTFYPRRWVVL